MYMKAKHMQFIIHIGTENKTSLTSQRFFPINFARNSTHTKVKYNFSHRLFIANTCSCMCWDL